MWLPFFLMLPVVLAFMILFYVVIYPPTMIWTIISYHALFRKTIDFDDSGIRFRKAYRCRQLQWDEISEAERRLEPTLEYYRFHLRNPMTKMKDFLAIEYERNDELDALIMAKGIPFKRTDWRHRDDTLADNKDMKK